METGGSLEQDVVPESVGFHVENVVFPLNGSPPRGIYEYTIIGGGDEPWNVTVAFDNAVIDSKTGVGDDVFRYRFGENASTRGTL